MNSVNNAAGSGAAGGGGDDNDNKRKGIDQGRSSPALAEGADGTSDDRPIKSIQAIAGGSITVPGGGENIQIPDEGKGVPVAGGEQSGGAADRSSRKWWERKGFKVLPGMSRPHISNPCNPSEDPRATLRRGFQDVLPQQQQGDRIRELADSNMAGLYQASNLSFVSVSYDGDMRLHFASQYNEGYLQVGPDGVVTQRCIPGVQAFLTLTTEGERLELERLAFAGGGGLTLDKLSDAARSVSGVDVLINTPPPLGTVICEINTVVRSAGLMVTGIGREGWRTQDVASIRGRVDIDDVIRQAMAMGPAAPAPSTRPSARQTAGTLGGKSSSSRSLSPGAKPRLEISEPSNFQHVSTGVQQPQPQPQPKPKPKPKPKWRPFGGKQRPVISGPSNFQHMSSGAQQPQPQPQQPQPQPQQQPQQQPQAAGTGLTVAGQSAQGPGSKPPVAPKPKVAIVAGKPVLLPKPVSTKPPATGTVGKPTPPPASAKPTVTTPAGPARLPRPLARRPPVGMLKPAAAKPSAPKPVSTGASPAPTQGADTLPQLESEELLSSLTLLRPRPARLQQRPPGKEPPKKPTRRGRK